MKILHVPPFLAAIPFAVSSASLLLLSPAAKAATVSFLGVEVGIGPFYSVQNWSNSGVAKTFDLAGSEVYGTSGYYQIRPIAYPPSSTIYESASSGNNLGITAVSNPTLYSAPVMLSSITGGAGDYVNFNSYSIFRGPDGSALYTQGGLSVPVNQGLYNTPSGTNSGYYGEAFSFTMGMSATFRLGIAVDTVASETYAPGTYAPDYVSLYTGTTGTVFSSLLTRDGTPDMAFFNIDAAAGDSFTAALWQLSGTQSAAAFGLITFDVSQYKFDVGSGQTQTNSAVLGGAPAALLKTGEGTLVLTGASTYQGATTINNGTVELGGAGTLAGGNYSGAVSLATSNSVLRIATSANQSMSGAISGNGSVTKAGAGALVLSGANTHTGNTLVSGGKIVLGSALALQNSAYDTASVNGGLDVTGFTTPTLGGLTGSVNLTSTLITGYGSISTLTLNPQTGITNTYSGDVGNGNGSMALTKTGSGTQILSGANTYTGATTVTTGILEVAHGNALGSTAAGTTVSSGAGLRLAGVTVGNEALTISGAGPTGTTWALRTTNNSGNSTWGGKITLTANATIQAASTTSLTLDVASGDAVDLVNFTATFNGAGTHQINDPISGTGGLIKDGSGTLTLAGANSYSGATTVNLGTLLVNGSTAAASAIGVSAAATLGGNGTVGGATTFTGASIHAPGSAAATVGTQTFSSTLAYGSGTIFNWDIDVTDPSTSTYDKVTAAGAITGGDAVFKIVLAGGSFGDVFWDSNRTWTDIFGGAGAPGNLAAIFSGFDASGGLDSSGLVTGQGTFTISNVSNTLTWTAVPEPTSALAGLLIGAGLLRRRRA